MVAMLSRGEVAPVVTATLPLAQAAEAHERLERGVVGKLVPVA
jgi:NADPH:quinone reductase-like Zn-dependent oxidoreductase